MDRRHRKAKQKMGESAKVFSFIYNFIFFKHILITHERRIYLWEGTQL